MPNGSVGLNSNSFAGVSLKRATITARTPRKKALTYNGDKETTLSTPFAEAPTFPLSADWAGTKRKGGPKKKRSPSKSPSNCAAKKEIVSLTARGQNYFHAQLGTKLSILKTRPLPCCGLQSPI